LQCQLARPVVQPAASPLMQFGGMFGGGGNKGGGGGGQVSARDADFARRQEKLASRKQASTTRLCATPCSPPAVCTRVSHNRDVGGCPEGRGRGHVSAEGQQGGEGQAGRAHWSRLQARWCARQVRLQEWPLRYVPGALEWEVCAQGVPRRYGPRRGHEEADNHPGQSVICIEREPRRTIPRDCASSVPGESRYAAVCGIHHVSRR